MSFSTKLINLLKTDPRFVDDEGELVLAAVQDRAWKIDHGLVKLLLQTRKSKLSFLTKSKGIGFSTSIPSSTISRKRTFWTTPTPVFATASA